MGSQFIIIIEVYRTCVKTNLLILKNYIRAKKQLHINLENLPLMHMCRRLGLCVTLFSVLNCEI